MPWCKEHTRPARRRGRTRRRYPVAVTFHLIDAVDECSVDRIVATHTVDPEVEYLQDHFPTFPVLPGVMMLEFQSPHSPLPRNATSQPHAIRSH